MKNRNRIKEILFAFIFCGLILGYVYFKYK